MFVCTYKILTSPDNDNQRPVYWALLSSTATSWMPSPLKAEEDDKAIVALAKVNNTITEVEDTITDVEKTIDMITPHSNKQGE